MKNEFNDFHAFKSQQCPVGELIMKYRGVLREVELINAKIHALLDYSLCIDNLKKDLVEIIKKLESL